MWNHSFLFGSLIHCPSRSPRNRCIFIMDLVYFWKSSTGEGKTEVISFGVECSDKISLACWNVPTTKKFSIFRHRNIYPWLDGMFRKKFVFLNWQTQKHLSVAYWPSPNLVRSPGMNVSRLTPCVGTKGVIQIQIQM